MQSIVARVPGKQLGGRWELTSDALAVVGGETTVHQEDFMHRIAPLAVAATLAFAGAARADCPDQDASYTVLSTRTLTS
jgi:hypothetical protein